MSTDSSSNTPLRVAILYTSEKRLADFTRALAKHDVVIIGRHSVGSTTLAQMTAEQVDVILVDLDDTADRVLDILQDLIETSHLPMLFNDSTTTELSANTPNPEWGRRLVAKLWSITKRPRPLSPKPSAPPVVKALAKTAPKAQSVPSQPLKKALPETTAASSALENLWVLGASLGGPLAVREFLNKLPGDLPVAFVLAQHIGGSHLELLAEQLNRVTPLHVFVATTGHVLKHQEVVLAPVDDRIVIDAASRITLKEKEEHSIYRPSIDFVMRDMAQRFGKKCNAIIFSGMGNDGERGCHVVAAGGGEVWAQDAESCVISSMPDNARKSGHVTFSGTPEELAAALVKRFSDTLSGSVSGN